MSRKQELPSSLILCLLMGFISGTAFAQAQDNPAPDSNNQGFALFEDIESSDARNAAAPTRRSNRQSRATIAEPEFTLLGTSRIGNKYSAILRHKGGEAIQVKAAPGGSTPIPDHGGYSVVSVAAGAVSIRYPGNDACVEFSDRGVTCDASDNTARLAIASSEPLVPSNPVPSRAAQSSEVLANASGGNDDSEEAVAVNPFAQLREARADAVDSGTAPTSRFSPRRIAPEDVPPGMRVVSTPFGDRLVDQ